MRNLIGAAARILPAACILLVSLLCVAGRGAALSADDGWETEDFLGLRIADGEDADSAEAEDGQSFAEVVAEADTVSGLFTLYHKRDTGEVWMEILPEQLGLDHILSVTRETGMGAHGVIAGLPAGHFVFRLHKRGDKIHFVRRNLMFRVAGAGDETMVDRSLSDHPLAALKIAGRPEETRGSWLVKLEDLFLGDFRHTASWLGRRLDADYRLASEQSWFSMLFSFPRNTEIGVTQTYRTEEPRRGWGTLADPHTVELELRYSISELPESDYVPRLADPRVGYFQTGWRIWGRDSVEDPMIRVANRWHLVKRDPAAELSEPAEPIVFWIENTVPPEYRRTVREGAELWNLAFERAGFRNALVVRQMPCEADWDPADIRYNVIRWISSSEPSFGAMGPSQVNPYTGQILNADILIEADMIRRVGWAWRAGAAPLGHASESLEDLPPESPLPPPAGTQERLPAGVSGCCAARMMAQDADLAALHMLSTGSIGPQDRLPWTYVEQYLKALVAHEVGHTLGLRHNFAASRLHTLEELKDSTLTQSIGLVSSVMEYDPVFIALDPAEQGDYYTRTLGPYDLWAVEWGYTPSGAEDPAEEGEFLERIAGRSSADPALRFGTDSDAYDIRGWASAVDPQIRPFDLSSEDLAWTRHQLELARRLLHSPPEKLLRQGDDHILYRHAFNRAYGTYWDGLRALTRYMGALHLRREPFGQGVPPLEPYSGREQREAFDLLLEGLFDDGVWELPADRLNSLGPGFRWSFDGSQRVNRVDLPLRERLAGSRRRILEQVYAPRRLARICETEARGDQADPLRLEEVFDGVREKIWSGPARSLDRRDRQRIHAELLIQRLLETEGVPEDARVLARADLEIILRLLRSWERQPGAARIDRQHMLDLAVKVEAALNRERDRL